MNNNVRLRVFDGYLDYLRISNVPALIDRAQLSNLSEFKK